MFAALQLKIQPVRKPGAKLARQLVQEQQAVLQPGQVFAGNDPWLRIRVGHVADDFALTLDAFELLHGQEVVHEAGRVQRDGERHGAIRARFEAHAAQRDPLLVAGVGGDGLYTLQLPRQGCRGSGGQQAGEQQRAQRGEWSTLCHGLLLNCNRVPGTTRARLPCSCVRAQAGHSARGAFRPGA
ncbi:hypothetical protein D3C78_1336620 [compost metagenome]